MLLLLMMVMVALMMVVVRMTRVLMVLLLMMQHLRMELHDGCLLLLLRVWVLVLRGRMIGHHIDQSVAHNLELRAYRRTSQRGLRF